MRAILDHPLLPALAAGFSLRITTFGTENVVSVMSKVETAAGEAQRRRLRTSAARSAGVWDRSSHPSVVSFVVKRSDATLARRPAFSSSSRQPSAV